MNDKPLNGWKILVVDDEPDSVDVAQTLLELFGAKVVTADNGQDGFTRAKEFGPDFILTDLSMPEMDGWEMLTHLKGEPTTKTIPTIAITAHAMSGDRERVIDHGFTNYISKPLNPETFVDNLLELLADVPELSKLFN